jgi:hypothetical protein
VERLFVVLVLQLAAGIRDGIFSQLALEMNDISMENIVGVGFATLSEIYEEAAAS